jgi:hypothetical protein
VRIGLGIAIHVAPLDNIAIESIPMPWSLIFVIVTTMILDVVGVITIEPIVYFYIVVRVDLVVPRRHPRFSFSSPAPLLEMAFQFRPVLPIERFDRSKQMAIREVPAFVAIPFAKE